MSERLVIEPVVIEPAKFAQRGEHLAGTLPLRSLSRIEDQLYDLERPGEAGRGDAGTGDAGTDARSEDASSRDAGGGIRFEVSGFVTARGHPGLHLAVEGNLLLRCQRCLGALSYRLEADRDIVFAPDADEFAPIVDEAETEDLMPPVARLDLRALLEEEVLLGLPLAPRHEDGACPADTGQRAAPFPSTGATAADSNQSADAGQGADAGTPDSESPFAVLAKLKKH
jgi:uncharacterized metal-binding protein YceD (DUF177 family)